MIELSKHTGIEEKRLIAFEDNLVEPSGDEVLILADYYKCDFRFFISNKKVTSFEQTDFLFRKYGTELSKADRWAIQEVLFLAENEAFLTEKLGEEYTSFLISKVGNNYKNHGISASVKLREHLNYKDKEIPLNIFKDFRSIGIRVYRRKLENSSISGLYIKHPVAGKCILINYSEDMFRQRFTAAHEAAHSMLDNEDDVIVSFVKWEKSDLSEIRANTFASHYLLPRSFIRAIPNVSRWDKEKVLHWSLKLNVNTETLAISLMSDKLIDREMVKIIRSVKIPKELKDDPELRGLSPKGEERKRLLLEKGLSTHYVSLCMEAYRKNIITASRMAEMLLLNEEELRDIMSIYGVNIDYGG
ncbi:ImmA/IrrE family metallo-endopeptidase [Paenibacillus paridis]|uniref:ImmA/IrrE family metallo-endopeptidase n=1 Tax=Paenibacillus paridis TaxID=2583376 RepID=UPI00192E6B4C|nr:ImmA/IrrE family metallo-endopeptidase [Paenibacillus paridis]